MRAVIPCIVLMLAVGGCGSSGAGPAPTATPHPVATGYDPMAAHIPTCAHARKAVLLPKGFPADFPLPPGSAITQAMTGYAHAIEVRGFVPEPAFRSTVNYFPRGVKKAGYTLRSLEADYPNDSEGEFVGKGLVGTWRVSRVAGCPHVMNFEAGVIKTK